jgi:hypothetical protein
MLNNQKQIKMKKAIFTIAMSVVLFSCTNNSAEVKSDVDTTAVVDTTVVDSTVVAPVESTEVAAPTTGITK